MHATVTSDSTVRTIVIEVTGAPEMDVTRVWRRNKGVTTKISPDLIRITADGDVIHSLVVSGNIVRKDGSEGARRDSRRWEPKRSSYGDYADGLTSIVDAPEYLVDIWDQALSGTIKSWTSPER